MFYKYKPIYITFYQIPYTIAILKLWFRLANIFHESNYGTDDIWRAVREAKSEFPVSNECGQMWTLGNSDIETIGRLVEQKLNVTSTSTAFESISEEHLKDAADMFLYLYTCPNPLKHWFIFYKDLLQNQSPDEIVLKLNRILKGGNSPESKYLKTIASGLFQRITTLFSLKYNQLDISKDHILSSEKADNINGNLII